MRGARGGGGGGKVGLGGGEARAERGVDRCSAPAAVVYNYNCRKMPPSCAASATACTKNTAPLFGSDLDKRRHLRTYNGEQSGAKPCPCRSLSLATIARVAAGRGVARAQPAAAGRGRGGARRPRRATFRAPAPRSPPPSAAASTQAPLLGTRTARLRSKRCRATSHAPPRAPHEPAPPAPHG